MLQAHRKGKATCAKFHVDALPDTGTSMTIVSLRVLKKMKLQPFKGGRPIQSAGGDPLECVGTYSFICSLRDQPDINPIILSVLVADGLLEDMLVSWSDLRALGVLPPSFPRVPSSGDPRSDQAVCNSTLHRCRKNEEADACNLREEISCLEKDANVQISKKSSVKTKTSKKKRQKFYSAARQVLCNDIMIRCTPSGHRYG